MDTGVSGNRVSTGASANRNSVLLNDVCNWSGSIGQFGGRCSTFRSGSDGHGVCGSFTWGTDVAVGVVSSTVGNDADTVLLSVTTGCVLDASVTSAFNCGCGSCVSIICLLCFLN